MPLKLDNSTRAIWRNRSWTYLFKLENSGELLFQRALKEAASCFLHRVQTIIHARFQSCVVEDENIPSEAVNTQEVTAETK